MAGFAIDEEIELFEVSLSASHVSLFLLIAI